MTRYTGQRLVRLGRELFALPSRPEILGVGATTFGLIFWLQSESRSSSRAYTVIRQWAPVSTWGFALFLIGLTLLGGIALRRHITPNTGLLIQSIAAGLGACWCTAWAIPLLLAAHNETDPRTGQHVVSYAGGALWLLWGATPMLFLAYGREG